MIDTGTGNTIELRRSGPAVSADGADGAAPPVAVPMKKKSLPATPNVPPPPATAPTAAPAAVTPPAAATPLPSTPASLTPAAAATPLPSTPDAAPVTLAGTPAATTPAPPAITVQLDAPTTPQKVGATFYVPVNLTGGQDLFSVPMELHYDPQKLTLVNVDNGDLLTRDGQIASLVHRDDNGTVHIATSRPQGMKGITGDGTVVTASFVAKAPGDAMVMVSQAMPRNSAQQVLPASPAKVPEAVTVVGGVFAAAVKVMVPGTITGAPPLQVSVKL